MKENYVKCSKCGLEMHPRLLSVHEATCKVVNIEKEDYEIEKNIDEMNYNELKKYIKANMETTPDGYTRMSKDELLEIAKGL